MIKQFPHTCIKCYKNLGDEHFPLGVEGTYVCHWCIDSFLVKYGKKIKRKKAKAPNPTAMRKLLVEALGGKCIQCGFADPRALQVDHINGGGIKEQTAMGRHNMFKAALQSVYDGTNTKYQLLCANCNWVKRYTHNELPKPTKKLRA